ncbi:MAG: MCE family protein [Planctomycetota bacterium]|nr:MAG: MCE family protein [Planctomycetota bacterium]
MSERNRNALIGAFVLGGLICLGTLIVKFGESRGLFSKRYIVNAKFERIVGVREGTDVNLAGVWAGSVFSVDLVDRFNPSEGVVVAMEIGHQFSVPRDSVATVITPLMGQSAINIIPPIPHTEPLPQDGTAEIQGVVKNPLETVIDPKFMDALEKTTNQFGALAEALTPAAKAVTELLEKRTIEDVEAAKTEDKEEVTANLYTAVERLHNVLKHIDTVLGDPQVQSNFKDTLVNFKAASEDAKIAVDGFRKFSENAQQLATNTEKAINNLSEKMTTNADKLSRLLDYFISASRDLAEGEGTMGMLLRDPKMYEALMLTIQRLGEAASELKVLVKQWQNEGLLSAR